MKDLLGKERYCYSIILYFTNEKQKLVLPPQPPIFKRKYDLDISKISPLL